MDIVQIVITKIRAGTYKVALMSKEKTEEIYEGGMAQAMIVVQASIEDLTYVEADHTSG